MGKKLLRSALLFLTISFIFTFSDSVGAACRTRSKTIQYEIGANVTQLVRNSIRTSMAAWEEASLGVLHFEEVASSRYKIDVISSDEVPIWVGPTVLAWNSRNDFFNYIYIVEDRIAPFIMTAVVIHEMGHSLGLEHNFTKELSYMHPSMIELQAELMFIYKIPPADRMRLYNELCK